MYFIEYHNDKQILPNLKYKKCVCFAYPMQLMRMDALIKAANFMQLR